MFGKFRAMACVGSRLYSPGLADDRQQSSTRGALAFSQSTFPELKKARSTHQGKGCPYERLSLTLEARFLPPQSLASARAQGQSQTRTQIPSTASHRQTEGANPSGPTRCLLQPGNLALTKSQCPSTQTLCLWSDQFEEHCPDTESIPRNKTLLPLVSQFGKRIYHKSPYRPFSYCSMVRFPYNKDIRAGICFR